MKVIINKKTGERILDGNNIDSTYIQPIKNVLGEKQFKKFYHESSDKKKVVPALVSIHRAGSMFCHGAKPKHSVDNWNCISTPLNYEKLPALHLDGFDKIELGAAPVFIGYPEGSVHVTPPRVPGEFFRLPDESDGPKIVFFYNPGLFDEDTLRRAYLKEESYVMGNTIVGINYKVERGGQVIGPPTLRVRTNVVDSFLQHCDIHIEIDEYLKTVRAEIRFDDYYDQSTLYKHVHSAIHCYYVRGKYTVKSFPGYKTCVVRQLPASFNPAKEAYLLNDSKSWSFINNGKIHFLLKMVSGNFPIPPIFFLENSQRSLCVRVDSQLRDEYIPKLISKHMGFHTLYQPKG